MTIELRAATLVGALLALAVVATPADAGRAWPGPAARDDMPQIAAPIQVPAAGTLEVAFAPNESAQVLEIKVIHSARTSLDMLAYNLTSRRAAQGRRGDGRRKRRRLRLRVRSQRRERRAVVLRRPGHLSVTDLKTEPTATESARAGATNTAPA